MKINYAIILLGGIHKMINKDDFYYFIHRTEESDYQQFFENGLYVFDKTNNITSTAEKIDPELINAGGLGDYMKNSISDDSANNYINVILVKIPSMYFPKSTIHRNGKMDVPIPFLYEKELADPSHQYHMGIFPVIIPCLIQGVYSKEDGFVTNENYNPVFDPSGLKFSKEQLEPIHNLKFDDYIKYNKRNNLSCDYLYQFDKQTGTWDGFTKYYSSKFNLPVANPFPNNTSFSK